MKSILIHLFVLLKLQNIKIVHQIVLPELAVEYDNVGDSEVVVMEPGMKGM